MTNSKLPGIYFSETVTSNASGDQEEIPCFLVQTSTAIASIDEQLVYYTSFDDFNTVATGKGLTETLKFIEKTLNEAGITDFYVYSIKTDTANGFTTAITDMGHLKEITSLIYFEETASANGNSISSKITAIKNGLNTNYENGTFTEGYIIPYGTVTDAVDDAENTTDEAALITSMTSILSGDGSGRICAVLPDDNSGIVTGKCISTPYNEEAGYEQPATLPVASAYNFTKSQLITLQNLGVIFLRSERRSGTTIYRINLAVTTSFKESKADGLLVSRRTADEILRRIDYDAYGLVKDKESESNLNSLQTICDSIIDEFASEESIYRDGTSLTASDAGNMKFKVTGTIKPIPSVIEIDVETVIA